MKNVPTISVIIPVYNRQTTVCDSISSVLSQTFPDFELILVDDGSKEDLRSFISSRFSDSRIKIIRHEKNSGAASARNTGVFNARGNYVAFLDSDDIWYPEKLKAQYQYMLQVREKNILASCTGFAMKRLSGRITKRYLDPALDWNDMMIDGCTIGPGSTLMAERMLFDLAEVGPYPTDLLRLEDVEWIIRYCAKYKLGIIGEPLSEVRVTGFPDYFAVQASANLIAGRMKGFVQAHFKDGSIQRFLASLEIEKGTAAYRKKKYVRAAFHYFCMSIYSPIRAMSFLRRIFEKLEKRDY